MFITACGGDKMERYLFFVKSSFSYGYTKSDGYRHHKLIRLLSLASMKMYWVSINEMRFYHLLRLLIKSLIFAMYR